MENSAALGQRSTARRSFLKGGVFASAHLSPLAYLAEQHLHSPDQQTKTIVAITNLPMETQPFCASLLLRS